MQLDDLSEWMARTSVLYSNFKFKINKIVLADKVGNEFKHRNVFLPEKGGKC